MSQRALWDKLNALVNDPGATDAERRTARRVLCSLDAKMGGRGVDEATVVITASQSWEMALLHELCAKFKLEAANKEGQVRIVGPADPMSEALTQFCYLRPELERVMLLSAAGWLAKHFPKQRGKEGGSLRPDEMRLVQAAAKSAQPGRKKPQRLLREAPAPLQLDKKD